MATWKGDQPELTYEDVNTGSIPPRPRLYGIVGGDVIMDTWKARQAKYDAANGNGNGATGEASQQKVGSA